jgi:hypothetical protein
MLDDENVACEHCGASGRLGEPVEHEPDCEKWVRAQRLMGEAANDASTPNARPRRKRPSATSKREIGEQLERKQASYNTLREKRRDRMYELMAAEEFERWDQEKADFDRRLDALDAELNTLDHAYRGDEVEPNPEYPGHIVLREWLRDGDYRWFIYLATEKHDVNAAWDYFDARARETGKDASLSASDKQAVDDFLAELLRQRDYAHQGPVYSSGIKSNPGPLRGPAMNTKFGADVVEDELDDVNGSDGRDLDGAMSRYETFHAKQPIRIAELEHDIPTSWICTGDGLSVMYKTDKWHKDGDDEEYKHLHGHSEKRPYALGKGVRVFEPATEAKRSRVGGKPVKLDGRAQRLPVAIPKALTLLGYCMGLFVRHTHDGEVYEVNPRGSYLFCSPAGDLLLVYSPTKQADGSSGFLCAMAGGSLRVLKDGIDG